MERDAAGEAAFTVRFKEFFELRMRPEIQAILGRRRVGMKYALLTAGAVFLVSVGVMLFFFMPHRQILASQTTLLMALVILAPLTMAILAFGIVYILSLRSMVSAFKTFVVNRLAEFIDPTIVHESGRTIPDAVLRGSLLFAPDWKVRPGAEHFRGRYGRIAYEFSEVTVEASTHLADLGAAKTKLFSGVFFAASIGQAAKGFLQTAPGFVDVAADSVARELAERHPGDWGSVERRDDALIGQPVTLCAPAGEDALALLSPTLRLRLAQLTRQYAYNVFFSRVAGRLHIALLVETDKSSTLGLLDGFDFSRCREFCHDAGVCLDLIAEFDHDTGQWTKRDVSGG